MENIKVSVIVPVYNSEKYLINCLSYLVNQTLQEIEIILVNDCSTDGSLAIMEECKRQFPDKVVLINSDRNRGPGGARNLGIAAARGEYIGFVDNDDQTEPDMYEQLYAKACESPRNDEKYDIVDSAFFLSENKKAFLTTSEALCGHLDDEKRELMMCAKGYLWCKIFKRSLFVDNDIKLLENTPFDDSAFLCYIYKYASSIAAVKKICYIHREHDESYSHGLAFDVLAMKWLECMEEIAARLDGKYSRVLEYRAADYYAKICNAFIKDANYADMVIMKKLYRFIKENAADAVNNQYVKRLISPQLLKFVSMRPEELMSYGRKHT